MDDDFKLDDFEELQVLGQGSFGRAVLVRWKGDGCHYVLKATNVASLSPKERAVALAEAKVHKTLDHPNVVHCYGSFIEAGVLYIVLEYADGFDLSVAVKTARKKGRFFSEQRVLTWLSQLVSALSYLHSRRILHRDIKASNVMLHGRDKVVRLGDLGIARVLDSSSDFANTFVGTPYYLSPELVSNEQYSYKSDVWSLGCLLYELLSLKHAFDASNMCALVLRILRGAYEPIDPTRYSPDLTRLVDWMLQLDPRKRPTMAELTAYPLIQRTLRECVAAEERLGRRRLAGAQAAVEDAVREAGAAAAVVAVTPAASASAASEEAGARAALVSELEEAAARVAAVSGGSGRVSPPQAEKEATAVPTPPAAGTDLAAAAIAEADEAEAEAAGEEAATAAAAAPTPSSRRSIRTTRAARRSASRGGVLVFRGSAGSGCSDESSSGGAGLPAAPAAGSNDSVSTFPSDAVGLDEAAEAGAGAEEEENDDSSSVATSATSRSEAGEEEEDDEEEDEEQWYGPVDPSAPEAQDGAASRARTRRAPHATISLLLGGGSRSSSAAPPPPRSRRGSRPGSRRASVVAPPVAEADATPSVTPAAPAPTVDVPAPVEAPPAVLQELLVTPDYRPDPEAHLLERFATARKARARKGLDMFRTMPRSSEEAGSSAGGKDGGDNDASHAAPSQAPPAPPPAVVTAFPPIVAGLSSEGSTTPSGVPLLPGMPLKTGPVRKSRRALVTPVGAGGGLDGSSGGSSSVGGANLTAMLEHVRRLEDVVLSAVGPGVPFGAPVEEGGAAATPRETGAATPVGAGGGAGAAAPTSPVAQRVPTLSIVRRSTRVRGAGIVTPAGGSDEAAVTPRGSARRRSRIVRTPVLASTPVPVPVPGSCAAAATPAAPPTELLVPDTPPLLTRAGGDDATCPSSDGGSFVRGFIPLPPPASLPTEAPAGVALGDRGRRRASWTRAHQELMSAAVHLEIAQHMRDMLIDSSGEASGGGGAGGPSDEASGEVTRRLGDSIASTASSVVDAASDAYDDELEGSVSPASAVPVTKPILAVLARIPSFTMGSFSSSSASASLLAAAGSGTGAVTEHERTAMGPLLVRGSAPSSGAASLNNTAGSAAGVGLAAPGAESGTQPAAPQLPPALALGAASGSAEDAAAGEGGAPRRRSVLRVIRRPRAASVTAAEAGGAGLSAAAIAQLAAGLASNSAASSGGGVYATASAPGSGAGTPTRRRSLRGPRTAVIVSRSRGIGGGGAAGEQQGQVAVRRRRIAHEDTTDSGAETGATTDTSRASSVAREAAAAAGSEGTTVPSAAAHTEAQAGAPGSARSSGGSRIIGVPPRHRQSRRLARSPRLAPSPLVGSTSAADAAPSGAPVAPSPSLPSFRVARLPAALLAAGAGSRSGIRIHHASRRHSTGSAVALVLADAPEGMARTTPRLTAELLHEGGVRNAGTSLAQPLSQTLSGSLSRPGRSDGEEPAAPPPLLLPSGALAALERLSWKIETLRASCENAMGSAEAFAATYKRLREHDGSLEEVLPTQNSGGEGAQAPQEGELPRSRRSLPRGSLARAASLPQLALAPSSGGSGAADGEEECAPAATPASATRPDVLARMQLLLGLEDQLAAGLSQAALVA